MSLAPTSLSTNTRNLVAACAAICVFGLSFGMTHPLLSLLLEQRGVSSAMIGINASMGTLGILLFSPFIPVLAKRLGSRRIAMIAAAVTALSIPALKVFSSLEAWFVLRFIQGMSTAALWALSEAWIVKFASDDSRGRVVAIYSSTLSASFGAGPLIIGMIGIEGWMPFIIGTIALVLGMIPLSLVRDEQTTDPEETTPSGLFDFAPRAPMLLACVAIFAVFDAATLALLPVYGIQNGLGLNDAAYLLSAMVLGNVVMQFPIGWLADRFPKRRVLAGCALTTAIFLALLPWTVDTLLRWPVVIIIGATGYGVYTVALASLGDRFSGIQLVNGAAAFASMWGLGAFIGSISGGWAMAGSASLGLPGYLMACYLLLAFGIWWRQRQIRPGP